MFREGNVQQEQLILPRRITVRGPSGGRYVIEGLLGKGESGAVYLVRNRSDRQHLFALKGLPVDSLCQVLKNGSPSLRVIYVSRPINRALRVIRKDGDPNAVASPPSSKTQGRLS